MLLQFLHPGKNWTCITDKKKLSKLLENFEVQLKVESSFFDPEVNDTNYVKKIAKSYAFSGGGNYIRPSYSFNIRRNTVNLQDNYFSRLFENTNEEFIDISPLFGR